MMLSHFSCNNQALFSLTTLLCNRVVLYLSLSIGSLQLWTSFGCLSHIFHYSWMENPINYYIHSASCSIICLQETKRGHFDHSYLRKFCPRRFDKFVFQPSIGASGGLIIIWNSSILTILTGTMVPCLPYVITVQFTSNSSLHENWFVSNIYGPYSGDLRDDFVSWMYNLEIDTDKNWIFMGDFNFVRSVENRIIPGGDMNDIIIFNEIISKLGLIEIPLKGMAYTWSKMQDQPLLQQLDWVFTSPA